MGERNMAQAARSPAVGAYLDRIPETLPPGKVLVHNHVRPADFGPTYRPRRDRGGEFAPPQSLYTFRAWLSPAGPKTLRVCKCGWAPRLGQHFRMKWCKTFKTEKPPHEQPTELTLWQQNGAVSCERVKERNRSEVSIGRTDSKQALGFVVTNGKKTSTFAPSNKATQFVLSRAQVVALHVYLGRQIRRLHGRAT